jgi:uncharacterized repeat protein (TIGR03803 family)
VKLNTGMRVQRCHIWPAGEKAIRYIRGLTTGILFAAVVAGCSHQAYSPPVSAATFRRTPVALATPFSSPLVKPQPRQDGSKFTSLYNFTGGADGGRPLASLTNISGVLYGTTENGGDSSCFDGCGVVYTLTTLGKESAVYAFKGAPDGEQPNANVIGVDGTLYGTTTNGGSFTCYGSSGGCGTVFKISPSASETVLHSFKGEDGRSPFAGLTYSKGKLYGTTGAGGSGGSYCADGCGTVFVISLSGKFTVLHTFTGPDGAYPQGSLTESSGALYGVTGLGGANGYGTVFKINFSGKEVTIHSFNGADGYQPLRALSKINGTFYGTTTLGGANGDGTVFKISPLGALSTVYSFKGGADGSYPASSLTNVKGALYGTTERGGTSCQCGTTFIASRGRTALSRSWA